MSLKTKIWGCRGSLPAPLPPQLMREKIERLLKQFEDEHRGGVSVPEFLNKMPPWQIDGYGGHTACIEVATPTQALIIDGGSGLRRFGQQLLRGPCGNGRGEVHILFTHFHWDHLIGLPFFVPIFIPGNVIHFYAVQQDLEKAIRTVFQKPFFPVPFEDLQATVKFHRLSPREAKIFGDIKVTPYELDHPDPCWGYRFENSGRVFSYAVDTEAKRMSREKLGADLPLYQNVNLMIFDAQYTFKEVTEKINWGHASAPIGIDIALREGVEKIYFVHHDPAASDEKIFKAQEQTREYLESVASQKEQLGRPRPEIIWGFAQEGMEFIV